MGVDRQLPEWIDKGGDDSDDTAENLIDIAKTVFEVFTEASSQLTLSPNDRGSYVWVAGQGVKVRLEATQRLYHRA